MKPTKEYDIYSTVSTLTKVYPTFVRVYKYAIPFTVREKGYEVNTPKTNPNKITNQKITETNLERSLRRTKTTITDITLSNEFDLFVTFTFKKDRQNTTKLKYQMSKWLKQQRQKHGKFDYIIVPEYHKDRKSIHFHALFKNYKGTLSDSGKQINRRKAYNLTEYKLGFNSAVKIDNIGKVSSYIRKYITKDMPQFDGKKRYWLSTGLKRPYTVLNQDYTLNPYLNFEVKFTSMTLQIHEANCNVKILTISEKEAQWNQKYYQTLPQTDKYQQLTMLAGNLLREAQVKHSKLNSRTAIKN